jgi:hypothetical protein
MPWPKTPSEDRQRRKTAAINFDPRGKLRPGEKVVIMCLACDRSQAQIVFGYISAYSRAIPALQALVVGSTRSMISLNNAVTIEVHTNSFRAVRGRSLLCCIFDELAFWLDEISSDPDTEVYNAVTPPRTHAESMLIMISSAHRRSGLLYQRWSKYFGQDKDNVLVVRGSTLQFNSSFDAETIERSLAEDREKYGAEYLWRDDLSAFLSRELLESLVDRHIIAPPPVANVQYVCGCDASGGRADSLTAAISHREKDGSVLLDALFERKSPFNPSESWPKSSH